MKKKNNPVVIPRQRTGKSISVEESIEFESTAAAKDFFRVVKNRLLEINNWENLAGFGSASFQLVNSSGQEVDRPVQQGDFFKIDIPGPGPITGDGYDWVKVEELSETSDGEIENIGICVRPTLNPLDFREDIAHFYSSGSSSSFTATRECNKITVGIYDRNVEPNKSAETLIDKVRDAVVSAAAATAFSRIQWKRLAKGILKTAENESS